MYEKTFKKKKAAASSDLQALIQWLQGISQGGFPDGDHNGPCQRNMVACSLHQKPVNRVAKQEHNRETWKECCHQEMLAQEP